MQKKVDNYIIFILFIIAYVIIFTFLGYLGYKRTKTAKDWYIAGGKMGGFVVALSYGATFVSAVALIGFSGIASMFGQSVLWLAFLNIFVGVFIAFVFFGLRTRKIGISLGAETLPELLGNRFKDTRLQGVSGAIVAIFMVAYTTAVFLAVSSLIKVVFGIPYELSVVTFTIIAGAYVLLGGLLAVMWAHVIQGITMFVGMLVMYCWMYFKLGGIVPAHEALASLTWTDLVNIGFPETNLAPNGLTSMQPFLTEPFMMVLTIIFGVGIGVLAQPQLIQRYLTAKNDRALRLAVPIGGIFILFMTFTAFSVGPLCDVFMVNHGILYPGSPDLVLPTVITDSTMGLFPQWFVLLFLFAILMAAMSTAAALFHVAGASVGRDVYDKAIKKGLAGKKSILVTRLATAAIIAVTLILSLNPPDVVAYLTSFFFGLMACTFLAPYTLTIYWRRITRAGAWVGLMSGFWFAILWYCLVYYKTAPSISGVRLSGLTPYLDPLFLAIPISFVLTIIVSLISKQLPKEHIDVAFENI